MWERFTVHAKQVVSAARDEAARLGSEYVRTEHILLALCRVTEGTAVKVLQRLRVDAGMLANEVEQGLGKGLAVVSADEIALTSSAKKVLELTVEEARHANRGYVGTEHMLLGLVADSAPYRDLPFLPRAVSRFLFGRDVAHTAAQKRLKELVSYDALRDEILTLLSRPNGEPA